MAQEDGSYAFYANVGHAKLPITGVAAIGDTVAGARPRSRTQQRSAAPYWGRCFDTKSIDPN